MKREFLAERVRDMREMHKIFGIPFTGGGEKTEQTKEPEAAPATEKEKEEQPEDKKVLTNHVLVVIKKPRSQSLIPVYVRVNLQCFRLLWSLLLFLFCLYCRPTRCLPPTHQEDVPAGEDGSGGSGDSDSDEDDSDEDSDESSEDDEEEDEGGSEEEGEKEDEPLSLEWPDTRRKQATYLFLLPIIFPLWLTVPDVRNQVKIQMHV